jgi:hypothetical protein
MILTSQELATVLAGLRHWQNDMRRHAGDDPTKQTQWARETMPHFDLEIGDSPLTALAIDDLCERLNHDAGDPPTDSPASRCLPSIRGSNT